MGNELKIKRYLSGFALFVVTVLVLLYIYSPSLGSPLFSTDDSTTFASPQFRTVGIHSLKGVFVPGGLPDYYPVVGLSYVLDQILWKNSLLMARAHQVLILALIGLFLVLICWRLGIAPLLAISGGLLWVFHPYHAEMVNWLTARKDLLSIMFATASFFFALSEKKSSLILMTISLVFSFGSKATFVFLPLAMMLIAYLKNKKNHLYFLTLASFFGVLSALFQRWYYSQINPMSVDWSFLTRLQLSAAGLGRMMVGWLNPQINAVDSDNFGQWIELNHSYIPIGLFAWALLLGAWLINLRKRSVFGIGMSATLTAVYLPVSGLVFPHMNFYSTRYFEPIGIILLVGLLFLLNQLLQRSKRIFVAIIFLLCVWGAYSSRAESLIWSDSLLVREKALAHSPDSISLKAVYLGELLVSPNTDHSLLQSIRNELAEKCESPTAPQTPWFANCHNYFRYGYELSVGKNNSLASSYLTQFEASRSVFRPVPRSVARLKGDFALRTGTFDLELIEAWTESEAFYPVEEYRLISLLMGCLDDRTVPISKERYKIWSRDQMILSEHLEKYIKSVSTDLRGRVELCLFKDLAG